MRKLLTVLLPFLSVFLSIIAAEALIRVYHFLQWDISVIDGQPTKMGGLSPITLDPKLGWRATENYRFNGLRYNSDGTTYYAKISQNGNGFRMFGNGSSSKPRVFVIGDSFTQATDASDDKTYYAIVKRLLDVEVFAYGGGGYGSLQEFMILDKYFESVRPDLILWQYSTNDFINNSPELETASTINNNGMIRPYWINDQIHYILPKEHAKDLRLFSLQYCRICYVVLNRLDRLAAAGTQKTVETVTSTGRSAHGAFLRSLSVTDEIMEQVRTRAGSVPIVGFIVGTGDPYGPEYEEGLKEISRRHNIILFDNIDRAVLNAEHKEAIVRAADGAHWNELGHHIAGEAIVADFRKACLLNSCQSVKNR